jgi:hypothetical protein
LFDVFQKTNYDLQFEQYSRGLESMVHGWVDEKLDIAFDILDINSRGYFDILEFTIILESLTRIFSNIMGQDASGVFDASERRDFTSLFNLFDVCRTNRVTRQQFKHTIYRYPHIALCLSDSLRANPDQILSNKTLRIVQVEIGDMADTSSNFSNKNCSSIERIKQVLAATNECSNQHGFVRGPDQFCDIYKRALVGIDFGENPDTLPEEAELFKSLLLGDALLDERIACVKRIEQGQPGSTSSTLMSRALRVSQQIKAQSECSLRTLDRRLRSSSSSSSSSCKSDAVLFGHKNLLVMNIMQGLHLSTFNTSAMNISACHFGSKETCVCCCFIEFVFRCASGQVFSLLVCCWFNRSIQLLMQQKARFVSYSSVVWRHLRVHFGISDKEYAQSLGPNSLISNLLLGSICGFSELGTEGKASSRIVFFVCVCVT